LSKFQTAHKEARLSRKNEQWLNTWTAQATHESTDDLDIQNCCAELYDQDSSDVETMSEQIVLPFAHETSPAQKRELQVFKKSVQSHLEKGRYSDAVEILERLLDPARVSALLRDEHNDCLEYLAIAHWKGSQSTKAIETLRKLRSIEPRRKTRLETLNIMYAIAKYFLVQNNHDEAEIWCNECKRGVELVAGDDHVLFHMSNHLLATITSGPSAQAFRELLPANFQGM
jgi:tetratricopeptide (TPR) repeat protein